VYVVFNPDNNSAEQDCLHVKKEEIGSPKYASQLIKVKPTAGQIKELAS
jgi:hypothetical protein